ncbi:precorrin-2 C(20)-methyltransferase [Sedimentibacter sp. MB31-C6]|uniref:precorrin-2 C(20)-methyltransferase n=1 Tax=Sedimentibacter sp. MB31-C6 TaxID=3109366 RepID=UPI002DDD747B|nr:precorrin-2 C(20)-methyltransferase [Sedimentibacter sp. MB36-C1]WSI04513.1 precorrin-2 C(20)-methyltransferase [Sedimentibacter sp. MB36-C1]
MFYGIGVGVGSSDTITKKAIDILKELDILFVPTAKNLDSFSVAHNIVQCYLKDNIIIKDRYFPMNYNTKKLQNTWKAIANEIEKDVLEDKKVGFVTIGDPMVYSTYIYLLKLLKDKVKIITIPGITSFLDIAANNNFPLVEGNDSLVIIPATIGIDKLKRYIINENSIVIMKVYKDYDEIINLLIDEQLERYAIAVSNSSKNEEVIYKNISDMKKEDISYFTTILINKKWEI